MPNWCRNELKVSPGNWLYPEAEKEEFLDALRESITRYAERMKALEVASKAAREKEKGISFSVDYFRTDKTRKLFDFENFLPYPENFRERDNDSASLTQAEMAEKYGKDARGYTSDGYNSGGYEWCVANWGTKWNASSVAWVDVHDTLYFDTPWGPPWPVLEAMHKRFPTFTFYFEWYERGMAVMGGCVYVPEKDATDYPEEYVPMGKEHDVEMALKKNEAPPVFPWAAGQPYNHWEQPYMGFKGG
ncbi:hypothetical protein [Ralstonia phage RP12]|uniref:YubB ferredoxin-like domain-containing protein n=1 Tax=Ralstonia phage RP12 TaxID=1923889 RepID=A0A1L7N0M5_9CAUD|nr:hypothetical protein FDH28_gp032 [Ralstonia phage RP12]BAW19006.1 hypothetical protein [Ralstonia phage RP12]